MLGGRRGQRSCWSEGQSTTDQPVDVSANMSLTLSTSMSTCESEMIRTLLGHLDDVGLYETFLDFKSTELTFLLSH